MKDIKTIQDKLLLKKQLQTEWKYKIIDLTIDILIGTTHRDKDYSCKELLKQIKNMPEIYDYELNIDEDLPF